MLNFHRPLLALSLVFLLAACGSTAPETPDNQDDPVNQGDHDGDGDGATDLDPPGESIQSALSREDEPDVDAGTRAQLSADNRDFAFSLFAQLREGDEIEEDENIFLSPHSISIAMAMAYAGADNQTREQMAEVLQINLSDDDLHSAYNALDQELATRSEVETEDGDAFDLDIVNQTWGQQDFNFEKEYLDILARHYGAGMRVVDFVNDFEEIRVAINEWVEARTNDRIQDLLPEGVINRLTRFVLVNAIYFYGSWENAFNEELTTDQPFHLADGSTVDVPLMSQEHQYGYFKDDTTIAASLPYVGNQVSLIAFMPADESDDFHQWEAGLERAHFDEIASAVRQHRDVQVYFPRFESEGDFSLKEPFDEMGMEDAFDTCDADFEKITGIGPCIPMQSIYISDILHKTFVSIDEEGTEAAAGTAVIFGTTDSAVPEVMEVRFDRPFYYAVYDHGTETILFLGRLMNPAAE